MKRSLLLIMGLILASLIASAAVSEEVTSVLKLDENTNYRSTLDMRAQRKLGVGTTIGGNLGVFGVTMELNFEDENGVVAGFGTGPGYNSFEVLWKHSFEGDYIAPFTTLGYSRWYNSSASSADVERSGILNRAVSDADKRKGQFATNFLSASIGLQYNQLSTELAGVSFFGEVILLDEVTNGALIPTGAVGAVYYF